MSQNCLLRVMSCNIRFFSAPDGINAWEYRKDLAARTIRSRNADIIGFQELWAPQAEFMRKVLPEYEWFGFCDDPDSDRPMNAIFWKASRFRLISPGGYWLSETPHISGSFSWDSMYSRLANWVKLEDLHSNRIFRLINTHLDHVGEEARYQQSRLINEDAQVWEGRCPQILTGDMNAEEHTRAIKNFLEGGWKDSYGAIHGEGVYPRTFHQFMGENYNGPHGKIDWIFYRGSVRPVDAEIVRDNEAPLYPSDHYFLRTDFVWER